MATILLSVPHTGTRFLMKYLEYLKVVVRFYHTEQSTINEMFYEGGSKVVVPMRDPLLCFLSHCSESPDSDQLEVAERVIKLWDILDQILDDHNYTFLRLDSTNQEQSLLDIAEFIEADFKEGFEWEPVGVRRNAPSDYELWNKLADEIGAEKSDEILAILKPYRDKYGY